MGKKHFCFFQTAETGNRTPDSGVKGSGANHYPRAPAQLAEEDRRAAENMAATVVFSSDTVVKIKQTEFFLKGQIKPAVLKS